MLTMMIVSTFGPTRECWEQNKSSDSLNKTVVKFTTFRVVFVLLRLISSRSHINLSFHPKLSGTYLNQETRKEL